MDMVLIMVLLGVTPRTKTSQLDLFWKLLANSFRSNAISSGQWSSKLFIPVWNRIKSGVLIWVEFKILSAFLILPHGIATGVANSPAISSLKFINFLLECIIIYKLPLPLSKIPVSLEFDDVFRCDGVRLDLSSVGGDNGGGSGDDDSCCVWVVMVFVLVLESLLVPVSVLASCYIYKEVSPFNPVSSVAMELLMVSNSRDIQFLDSFILFLFCGVVSRIWFLSCSIFKFASFNSSFSFIFSRAIGAIRVPTILLNLVGIFAYSCSYRLANCAISSSILLMVFLILLCISSVTILVLLHLSIVFFFVVILFCLLGDFGRTLSLMSSVFRDLSSISINTISSWLVASCLLSISLVWGVILEAFVGVVFSNYFLFSFVRLRFS